MVYEFGFYDLLNCEKLPGVRRDVEDFTIPGIGSAFQKHAVKIINAFSFKIRYSLKRKKNE